MDSSLLMVIQSYFGIFLLLLLTFTSDFIENIIKNYDVTEIFKTIFRILAFVLLVTLIVSIAQEFVGEETSFTISVFCLYSYVLRTNDLVTIKKSVYKNFFQSSSLIILIVGISFFLSLFLGYLDTGTFVNPLYDYRYFIAGLFISTISSVVAKE